MNKNEGAICFQAQIQKVQTLADGGLRLTLDLAESEIDTATKMMQAKQAGAVLEIAALPMALDEWAIQ